MKLFIIWKVERIESLGVSNVINIEVVLNLDIEHVDFVANVGNDCRLGSRLSLLLFLRDHFILSLHLLLYELLLSALELRLLRLLR